MQSLRCWPVGNTISGSVLKDTAWSPASRTFDSQSWLQLSYRGNYVAKSISSRLAWVWTHYRHLPPASSLAAGSVWKGRLFWSFTTETLEVFIDKSWLFCLVLRDLQLLVISVVKGAKGRILASLAALHWEIIAVKGPSTKMNKVPDWAGSVGGLCKTCSALQNSASSLKILFHHPTAWVDRDGSF